VLSSPETPWSPCVKCSRYGSSVDRIHADTGRSRDQGSLVGWSSPETPGLQKKRKGECGSACDMVAGTPPKSKQTGDRESELLLLISPDLPLISCFCLWSWQRPTNAATKKVPEFPFPPPPKFLRFSTMPLHTDSESGAGGASKIASTTPSSRNHRTPRTNGADASGPDPGPW